MADIKTYKSTLTGHQLDEALAKLGQVDSAVQQSEAAAAQAQGYADSINPAGFATASQGKKADTAVQPSDVLNLVYPVGAIYISCNSTGPATLFGGTWEQIQGRFLLASSESYPAGSTGGDATHSHEYAVTYHTFYGAVVGSDLESINVYDYATGQEAQAAGYGSKYTVKNDSLSDATSITNIDIQKSTGHTSAESSLPPYLAVYVWKRTA